MKVKQFFPIPDFASAQVVNCSLFRLTLDVIVTIVIPLIEKLRALRRLAYTADKNESLFLLSTGSIAGL
jgi:hypothetical protein